MIHNFFLEPKRYQVKVGSGHASPQVGLAISTLRVQFSDSPEKVRLSDLRSGRGQARRVVIVAAAGAAPLTYANGPISGLIQRHLYNVDDDDDGGGGGGVVVDDGVNVGDVDDVDVGSFCFLTFIAFLYVALFFF